mgnify:CR=1 FL=1
MNVVENNNIVSLTRTSTVTFAWQAPQLGDFAYIDGTFSSSYDPSKTMVGIIYAKDETTAESGIVHIMGKEFATETAHYLGYAADGIQES